MKADEMVKDMFRNRIRKADLVAVCRSRGFDARHISSPELLEHLFLSPAGVESAMAALGHREVLILHVLNCLGKEVGIELFEDVYGKEPSESRRWIPSSERYRGVLRGVQAGLIQKGLLVVAEARDFTAPRSTVLERLRFLFPPEFAPFLPPPFRPIRLEGEPTREHRGDFARRKIQEVLEPLPEARGKGAPSRLHVAGGDLLLGDRPFTARRLGEWQARQWDADWPSRVRRQGAADLTPSRAVLYALGKLEEHEAAAPEDLAPFVHLAVTADPPPDVAAFCLAGLERGCLERVSIGGRRLYRLPDAAGSPRPDPGTYLDSGCRGGVDIDVSSIPPQALEVVASVSHLEVTGGRLTARAGFHKTSSASEEIRRDPVFAWLVRHHESYRNTVEAFERRRGRTFIHEDILVARVTDLSLKVQIERKLGESCRALSEEFLAFPRGALGEVIPLVKKAGHVVKTVSADGDE